MSKFLYKNHELIEEKKATISIHERGFLFGDGLFETCKIFNGNILDFDRHKARIIMALDYLGFSTKVSDLQKKSQQLIRKNQVKNGVLRISISRGIGSKGYLPTHDSEALIIIETLPERELPKKIRLGISKIPTPGIPFKSISALPYTLAKIEANKEKNFDCVMLSPQGFIAETSCANIFWIKNGVIYTSHESCGIVLGCVRDRLLKMPELKIKKVKTKLSALKNADEIFLTNSLCLVLPVDEFLGRKLEKKLSKRIKVTFL
ncbi:MAG: hypothetical protein FJX34_05525, partial [Alphaproteobacteria bacterium]|nr:hypothetical protein [Alphaproteobacteria bacterium]